MASEKFLWSSESGIEDLPSDYHTLSSNEVKSIAEIWGEQRDRLQGSQQLKYFTTKLSREWAIETGIIENLYEIERGVTQTLIERGFQSAYIDSGATNKPKEYVIRLLKDQEEALEGLFDFVSNRRRLSTSYIKELHAALCRNQSEVEAQDGTGSPIMVEMIRGAYKRLPNFPERDGVIYKYCPPEHVDSEMDRLVALHAEHLAGDVPAEIEAAWLHHRFSIIHPFQDGNGRVARAIASLVFIQRGLFPLVVTRDDKVAYLEALEAGDDGNLKPLVDLFSKLQRVQFRKATAISESILSQQSGVKHALNGLIEAISKKAFEQQNKLKKVFEHARQLEDYTESRFNGLMPQIESALKELDSRSRVQIDRAASETDYYFRGQIIEIAKRYLHYYADTGTYKSWIRMKLSWSRRAQLVIAFHSTGAQFAGVLVAAPFLEFRDDEDTNEPRVTLVNLTEEPFQFYYNETPNQTLGRYEQWLDSVLTAMLAELHQNL